MAEHLNAEDLVALVRRVFLPRDDDTAIGILVDLPDEVRPDHPAWRTRPEMAAEWAAQLASQRDTLGLHTDLVLYRNAHTNNGDLPTEGAWIHRGGALPASAEALADTPTLSWAEVFSGHSILIAPTQYSATAPLKVAARSAAFRAATMPGLRADMIPAFGRSEHFGGQVGPKDFSSPDAVVHIDRVYVPACQPQIQIPRVDPIFPSGDRTALMIDGA